jgi:ActR/RegA family two-component response regulator
MPAKTGQECLLVDDELSYLEVLKKRLGKRKLVVTTASSGSDAIRLLREI